MNAQQTVVIAGGSGFLGTAVSKALLERGLRVVVLSRDASAKVPVGAEVVQWDPYADDATPAWHHAVHDAMAVINLCGSNVAERRWSARRRANIIHSRVQPTRALVRAIRSAPPLSSITLVQTSAVGYYGDAMEPVTEASPHGQTFLGNVVNTWEHATDGAVGHARVVILRVGVVLDLREGALASMLPMFRIGLGGRLGKGCQYFPWVHVDDVVNAYVRAVHDHSLHGVYNIASPNVVTMAEFAGALGSVMRRPSAIPVPVFALRLALGKRADIVVHGHHVVPMRTIGAHWKWEHPYLNDALKNLLAR